MQSVVKRIRKNIQFSLLSYVDIVTFSLNFKEVKHVPSRLYLYFNAKYHYFCRFELENMKSYLHLVCNPSMTKYAS
jgi:hypothetical protein